jgi:hypothetical protein
MKTDILFVMKIGLKLDLYFKEVYMITQFEVGNVYQNNKCKCIINSYDKNTNIIHYTCVIKNGTSMKHSNVGVSNNIEYFNSGYGYVQANWLK